MGTGIALVLICIVAWIISWIFPPLMGVVLLVFFLGWICQKCDENP